MQETHKDEWKPFEPEPLADFLASRSAAPSWLVEGLLPWTGLAILAGDPKSFKTFLAAQVALSVASEDIDFLGWPTAHGRVLFVEEEGSRNSHQERLGTISQGLGSGPSDLSVLLRRGVRIDTNLAQLSSTCERDRIRFLVLDPLSYLHGRDENRADAMAPLMRDLSVMAHKLEMLVLVVHHVTKPQADRHFSRAAQRLRGSTAVAAAADAILVVDRRGDELGLHADLRDGVAVEARLIFDPATLLLSRSSSPERTEAIPRADLLDFVKANGKITTTQAAQTFHVVKNTAGKALNGAHRDGALDRTDGPRGTFFYPVAAPPELTAH